MNLTWISWMLKLKMFPFTLAKAVQVCSFLLVFGFLSLTVLEIEAHVSTEHFSVCISSNLSKQFQEKHTERTYSFLGAINHCHAPRCALSVLRSGLSCDMHEKKICTAVLANLELQSETGWKGEIRDQISYGICVMESDWTMDFLSDQTACPSGPKLLFKKNLGSSTSTHWHSSNRPSPPTNSVVRLSGVCQKKSLATVNRAQVAVSWVEAMVSTHLWC